MSTNLPYEIEINRAEIKPTEVRKLIIRGVELEFAHFADGYIQVSGPFTGLAHKVRLGSTIKQEDGTRKSVGIKSISGFVHGIATVMDSKNGTFRRGLHCAMGIERALNIWQTPMNGFGQPKAIAYANWGLMSEDDVNLMADHGIDQGDAGNNWVALSVSHRRFFRAFVVRPVKSDEFVAEMAAKGVAKADITETMWDIYKHAWNIQNKHDGIEVVLDLLSGVSYVGIKFSPATEREIRAWDGVMADYADLWKDVQVRVGNSQQKVDNINADRKLRSYTNAMAQNPEFKVGEFVQAVKAEGMVTVRLSDGNLAQVSTGSMIGQRVQLVYADGSPVDGSSLSIRTEAHVLGVCQMAQNFRALIAFVS